MLIANWREYGFYTSVTLAILLLAGCSRGAAVFPPSGETGDDMATLTIDFQEGFAGDTVVLSLNGDEVLRQENITTKMVLGYAGSFESEVETGSVSIEIYVQTKDLRETVILEVSEDTYLGISITDGKIETIQLDEPFRYG